MNTATNPFQQNTHPYLWDNKETRRLSRWVVVSHEAKKQYTRKYSGLLDHFSELFTRMIGLKF